MQMSAKERKCPQKSANASPQKSAKRRKRKSAKECQRAHKGANAHKSVRIADNQIKKKNNQVWELPTFVAPTQTAHCQSPAIFRHRLGYGKNLRGGKSIFKFVRSNRRENNVVALQQGEDVAFV